MFFSHWYFCYHLKMSALDTYDYLEFLFALEEDVRPLEERLMALEWLDKQEEPLLKAYAIPQLINGVLEGNTTIGNAQGYGVLQWQIYVEKTNKIIFDLLEHAEQRSNVGDCLNLIKNMDEVENKELVDQLLALPYIEPDHKYEFSYLESDENVYSIVILSILCAIAKKEPKMVLEAIAETSPRTVNAALEKEFGRLPWKLAMLLRSLCGAGFNEVKKFFPKYWLDSVECLEVSARIILEKEKKSDKSHRIVVDNLLEEACNLDFCEKNRQAISTEEFWINEKADYPKRFKICAILWQNILWNTAFEYDAEICVERLKTFWNVPVYGKIKRTGTRRWRNLLIPSGARVANTDSCYSYYFCTPWQRRTKKRTESIENKKPFQEFNDMLYNESAFRSFAAAILLRRMMGSMREFPIEYCRILLNMGDIFQCEDVNAELTGESKYWENAVRLLGYFAKQSIDMLGRGELNNLVPKKMIDVIRQGKKKEKNNPQINEQAQITGVQVCAHWAVESLRGGCIRQERIVEGPWFDGDEASAAIQLCKWFFENGIKLEDYDYREPVLLCFQAFPEVYHQIVETDDAGLWIEKYRAGKERISFYDIMLTKELFLEDWEELKDLDRNRFDIEMWTPILTLRFIALLKNGKVEEHQNWYVEWKNEIADHASSKDAYGILFYLLCELLAVEFPDSKMPRVYTEIVRLVIGTIHSYTSEKTIFYQYYLTVQLENAWKNYGIKTGAMFIAENIRELYRKQSTAKGKMLLAYSLVRAKSEMPPEVLEDIYDIMKSYWERRCASGKHHAIVRIEEREWNPVTDFELQENNGHYSVMRPVQDIGRVFRREAKNLFRDPLGAESEGWYVGIVTNEILGWNRRKEKEYFIQYGTGNKGCCTSMAYYRKGEMVGVHLDQNGKLIEISKLAWKNDKKPLQVSLMELTADVLKLRLPNGETFFTAEHNNENFHMLLSLWEPDLSKILQGKMRSRLKEQPEVKREVRFDAHTGSYVPVERDFYRMVFECFFSQGREEKLLKMIFIRESNWNGKRRHLFSVDVGVNYLLAEENWERESFEILEKKLVEGNHRQGLIIMVCLQESGNMPVLSLDGATPFDDRNWEWENYFSEEEFFVVQKENCQWYADIKVANMPNRVKAAFKPFSNVDKLNFCNVQLCYDGWDIGNRRHGKVQVEKLQEKRLKKEWCTLEGFKKLREVKAGDILMLENNRLRKQRDGYHAMLTESGLPVFCAAESLSLETGELSIAMISGRACVVEYADSWEAKKEPDCEAIEIPELEETGECVSGLIAQFTEELNTPNADIKKLSVGVWLKVEEEVKVFRIPVTAFSNRPKALGAPVTAVRQRDGKWLFAAYIRRIQVRALWQIENNTERRGRKITGIRLGRNMNVPGVGQCFVTQATDRPLLYLWNMNTIQKDEMNTICGVAPGKGSVSKIKRRNFPWEIFPYAKYKELVRLSADGKEYYGDCTWGEFDESGLETRWSVDASVYLLQADNDIRYYDLRRNFYNRSAKQNTKDGISVSEKDKQLDEQYAEWINAGDYHVIGTIIEENGKKWFRMDNLKVPQHIGRETLRDKWTDKISFVEDDRCWVLGRYYPKNRVRALLMRKDEIWVASCHEAEAFYVNDELAREFNVVSGDVIRRKLYYAGLDEDNCLRFEWGYGFTFLVDEEDILDEDGHKIGHNLFYGDMIQYFTLVSGEGKYGWHIRVEYKAIIRQVESRIWEDGNGGKAIIQLLEIRRDLEKRKVFVERVSVTEGVIQQEAGLFNSWDFQKVSSAKLEEESILALLDEDGYDQETKIIFARLKPEADRRRVTCLTFTYMPLEGKRGDTWLLEGQVVCMVAGEIKVAGAGTQNNRLSNDYMLPLYLPNELPRDQKNPRMCVNVLRREFSVDESKLRTLYATNKAKYYECKMLVRLKTRNESKNGRNEWKGNIINTPKRTRESLHEWIASEDHCLVTLGMENKQLLAEVAPGIIGYIEQSVLQGTFSQGTLAILWMEEGVLKGKAMLPGDGRYLPGTGRPAELLVMDGAAKNYRKLQQGISGPGTLSLEEQKRINEELSKAQFTVAGLPQLLLTDRALLEKKISEPIPRLAYLVREQKRGAEKEMEIHVQEKMTYHAARLYLNQNEDPELHYFYPVEQVKAVEWGLLSFMDGTISELIAFVKRGRWHYHDRSTAIYHCDRNYLEAQSLPDGKKYHEIILFPDKKGNLRYRQTEFLRYGYPAREIIENGLPIDESKINEFTERIGEYPIAGVTDESIWIEIFPGKLLEIPIDALSAGEKKIVLSGLWTGMFCEGDRIQLCQDAGYDGNHRKLVVKNIVFGARAVFGDNNTFLPIREFLEDGLVLGTELWPIVLPIKGNGKWAGEKIVCATRDNKFFKKRDDQKIFSGDVMLVSCDKEQLSVIGWNSLKVTPAYRNLWENAEWLVDDILSRDGRRWMQESEITIPVEVRNTKYENGALHIWVFYRQPDMDALPCGTQLCCKCAGLRRGRNGVHEIVVRTGKSMLRIPIQNILPGIDSKKMSVVVKTLKKEKICFWIHKEEDGWYSGLRKKLEKERLEIHMLFCVQEASGILCYTRDNLALRWLPAEKAARAGKIPLRALWKGLGERKDRTAKRLDNGNVSLIDTWQNEQKYEVLKTDGTRYRATPVEKMYTDFRGVNYYLAELHARGDLICLYSETEYDCEKRDPIPIEIEEKQIERVMSFPHGQRRRTLHLSSWVYKAIRSISTTDDHGNFAGLSLYRFEAEIPECFKEYRELPGKADRDSAGKQLDYELLRDHGRTSQQLIYLYALISKKRGNELNFYEVYELIRLTLRAWLEEEGKFLASGLAQRVTEKIEKIDVAPAIAAVLLLNLIKSKTGDGTLEQVAKPLSVHLARMLGICCGSTIHQELLLKQWIMEQGKKDGLWRRLNQLSLRGEKDTGQESTVFDGQLTPNQVSKLLDICYSLKMHTFWDKELELVVDSILLSAGCLEECDMFYGKMQSQNCITERLSILGRILTPGAGKSISGSNLSQDEVSTLHNLLTQLLQKDSVPLSLVTDTPIPISEMERNIGVDLCKSFCKLVLPKR